MLSDPAASGTSLDPISAAKSEQLLRARRQEVARRLQAVRNEIVGLIAEAPSPALEMLLWHVLEHVFVAQEYADPGTVTELTPYDHRLALDPADVPGEGQSRHFKTPAPLS
ncbi:MAG: hypothetical protein IMW90_22390 [Thermogemmatispora sp.]|jgi:hypothetical protein|uniref:hypothetical protein n=1 Tax=Thermogemmatispora sp. TaxID=1968838 RepID=UPI0019F05F59|nr:hypothetical protein [Thermogemmatispora sp.]MBE3568474.1 hypothetical protein [Thermogemmatispora sp.]